MCPVLRSIVAPLKGRTQVAECDKFKINYEEKLDCNEGFFFKIRWNVRSDRDTVVGFKDKETSKQVRD